MTHPVHIMWFRQDLRLADNPALTEASRQGLVMPIYILDDDNAGEHAQGAASRWWLHYALESLNESLGGKLSLYRGKAEDVLGDLQSRFDIASIQWNRCYEPWRIDRDARIKAHLADSGVHVDSHNGSLLWEPWQALKADGDPYRVFTPFYRKGCLNAEAPREPIDRPENLECTIDPESVEIDSLALLPRIRWDRSLEPHWDISEQGASTALRRFLDEGIDDYKQGRNFPARRNVSRLSPYLHFGLISPHTVWYASKLLEDSDNVEHFRSELGWREFSNSLLYHFPQLPRKNLQPKFDNFPWQDNDDYLAAWQRGQTGYPIVDAGMRELWQTGYMHNRVRMIVGSFLVKNLLLHWHHGERWFWECLVDADLANNSASWQWIAGCGADAAPYFRIFNPVTQGEKFDPDGSYTRQYVPELADMPDKYLFQPWQAPAAVLESSSVILGQNYPKPIVNLRASREAALAAFQTTRQPTA